MNYMSPFWLGVLCGAWIVPFVLAVGLCLYVHLREEEGLMYRANVVILIILSCSVGLGLLTFLTMNYIPDDMVVPFLIAVVIGMLLGSR